jgi:hypothetical protein
LEQTNSILSSSELDSAGIHELNYAGKWSKFIGIVYIVSSVLVFLTMAGMFIAFEYLADINEIADYGRNLYGISDEAMSFLLGAGKWLFIIMTLITSAVLFRNGYLLLKFETSSRSYFFSNQEEYLVHSFRYLTRYFMITVALSLFSTITTIVAIIYYFTL